MRNVDFTNIFNSLEGHILVFDPDFNLIAVSQGILNQLGVSREKILGQKMTSIYNVGNLTDQAFFDSIHFVRQHKLAHEMDVQIWGTDPVSYWKPRSYPVLDDSGELSFIIHESSEVTKHISKQKILSAIEKELLKHTTLTDILDRQSDGFFIMDRNEILTFVNRKMREFGNFKHFDEMVGRPVRDVFTSKDTEKFIRRYRHIIENKTSDHFTETLETRYLSVDAYATQDESVAVFFRDVTERVETEKEILENRAKLQIITDHIPAFVAYFDTEGRYQFVNNRYEEWFGLSKPQIIGKKRRDFVSEETSKIAQEFEDKALRGEVHRHENVLKKGDETIYVDVAYVPDRDEKTNSIRGAIVIGYDVTNQVLARKEMEKALQLREDFMSIASHELKTPITSLTLKNQLFFRKLEKSGMPDEREMKKFLTDTGKNIKRINRLIEDMLDISRIKNGKMSLTLETFDLVDLAKEVHERYTIYEIPIHVSSHAPIVGHWDRLRLDQVLSNLITNAIKYGNDTPIEISFGVESQKAILRVKDFGHGIAKENQERIFQRFEREHRGTNVTGLGLGLFICKEILERHGGTISVQSELGQGAEFRIELPLVL